MSDLRGAGQPAGGSGRERSDAERRERRDVLIFLGIFGGMLLVNGLLTVAVIAVLEALGWWDSTTVIESIEGSARWTRWRLA